MITVNLYYTGKDGNARAFAEEMESSGIADEIRAEKGNIEYRYFYPADDPETVLLIDSWTDQAAIDEHHKSPMMKKIVELRNKYDLSMEMKRFAEDKNDSDLKYIRTKDNDVQDLPSYHQDNMSFNEITAGIIFAVISIIMVPIVILCGEFFLTTIPGFLFTILISLCVITSIGFGVAFFLDKFSKRNITKETMAATSVVIAFASFIAGLVLLIINENKILGDLMSWLIWICITAPAVLSSIINAISLLVSLSIKAGKLSASAS